MPFVENVDELAEWLADECGVWGSYDDEAMAGHPDACHCRLCWTMDVKRRMREAVRRDPAAVDGISKRFP